MFRKRSTILLGLVAAVVISNLKAWLIGTHHGVGRPHLQAYLDEFVFRFNRRQTPEAAFQTLLGLGSSHAAVRRTTIIRASDLPYPYEGDEIAAEGAGRARLGASELWA